MLPSLDRLIIEFDSALRTAAGTSREAARPSPANDETEPDLTPTERDRSARLMRVNYCGEVCAQALYSAQAITTSSPRVAATMREAAREENDHLAWCESRISELDSHVSYLNPLWYATSFAVGLVTGALGDRINLGFVAATEEEVCNHLDDHLKRLPDKDVRSRKILEQMRVDEAKHATTAFQAGGARFPAPVKKAMQTVSRLMTESTYWL